MPAATVFAATFPTWQVAVGALLAGFASGVLAALLGIGGAVVTTPVVRLLGGTPIEAVGSTVPAIIPGAISGAWRYAREGLVHWRIAGVLGVSGAAMAVVGALVSDAVEGRVLMVLTAVVMLWAGGSVVWRLRVPGRTGAGVADDADEVPEAPDALVAALGAGAGFIAGLLGVGGGIVIVPVLSGPLRLPMRSAVASSLVAVATFQVPALVTHIWLGHVDWMIAVPLALGVVPGAQVGARLTIAASDRTVRALFGMLVVVMAVIYGVSEARGLLVGS
ncbi:MAG: sulfite exporter TauE/SafE family protein [Microthrixaceae bacterium]|nr:sulfite exporter TauE/SafE family protein [Microthrixaceae bacterium]MCO5317817.1 sulfite exporter TauE/SafE family protein [Microthrixaceae bacterium]